MLRASFLCLLAFTGPAVAQRARFAPGEIAIEKALLLGPPGEMLPLGQELGPFGDLDGDGDVDLLHGGGPETRVHFNDGFGSFRASRTVSVAQYEPWRLGFFHADSDTNLDLLTRAHLYLGDGAGGFDDASANLPIGFLADAAVLADLDGDGDEDVLSIKRYNSPDPAVIRLNLNDGSGVFSVSAGTLPAAALPYTAVAGDVDGDMDLDLVIATSAVEQIWLNDGLGGFTLAPAALPAVDDSTMALALVDVDGDTDLDLVIGNSAANNNPGDRLLVNDGSGIYAESSFPDNAPWSMETRAILVLDCENDGDADLVLVHRSEAVPLVFHFWISFDAPNRLLVNDGTGIFADSSGVPPIRGSNHSGFAGDVDGDGDPDLVIAEDQPHPHRLFLNDGQGIFQSTDTAVLVLAGEYDHGARSVAIGDLDGDGLPDGFTPQAILINGPPGVFTPLATTLPPLPFNYDSVSGLDERSFDVSLGDVDGDGDLDAYIAGPETPVPIPPDQSNRLWVNDGSGGFTDETGARLPEGWAEVNGTPRHVVLIELDDDGDLDAACVRVNGTADARSSCYVNDGTGVFVRNGDLGYTTRGGELGDLDGDGDADYFEGSDRTASVSHGNEVWANDGSAHFALSPSAIPPHAPTYASWCTLADIDLDGDLDAYVDNGNEIIDFMYVNSGTGTFVDEPERLPGAIGSAHPSAIGVDGDGDLDLVGSGLLLNDGRGFFHYGGTRPYQGDQLAAGDLDLDGDADLLLTDAVHTTLAVGLARHLESVGPARLGKRMTLVVHGPPRTPYILLESLRTVRFPLGSLGWLLVHPGFLVFTTSGYLDGRGETVFRRRIPTNVALLGTKSYWQAFVGKPSHGSNLLVSTITGL